MPKIFEQQETNITHAIRSENSGSFIVRVQSEGLTKSLSFPYVDEASKDYALLLAKAEKQSMLTEKRHAKFCRASLAASDMEAKQCSI